MTEMTPERFQEVFGKARNAVSGAVVGHREVINQVFVAILAGGHCLLEGVPGIGKTLLVRSVAGSLDLEFTRIQFTPDLMPSDITGTEVIQDDPETGERRFQFLRGPIFANVILADEINRAPAKVQSALLEAMQERQVSIGGETFPLPKPFLVLATQNPIEQEGTYPLPEAQLDRFMFKVNVAYPSEREELEIVQRTTGGEESKVDVVLSGDDILKIQAAVRRVPVADPVVAYAVKLVRATRVNERGAPDFVKEWVRWGAGPRAAQYLILGRRS